MPVVKFAISTPPTGTETDPKRRVRVRYNQVMKLVRRAHLYAGLFMTPWVFLYGFTALLFNHPDAFPDARVVRFGPADTVGTPLADAPQPEILAGRVVAALNATGPETSKGLAYRLVRPAEARYAREFFAALRGDGQEHIVRMDLASGVGTVRSQRRTTGQPAPFVTKGGVKLDPRPMEPVTRTLPDFLGRLGIPGETAVERSFAPDLAFLMEGGGQIWRVTYSPQSGQLSGRPEAEGDALTARSYLLRLHLSHEYPPEFNARWFWAVGVDAMFLSMIGWGVTGLLMWWQMRNLRKIGTAVLIASALTAAAIAIGMHRIFTT